MTLGHLFFSFKVYETIFQSYKNEGTEQGYSTRQISFCVNNGKSQDFHSVFVHEQIRISFEIVDQQQQNFVSPEDARRREFVSTFETQKLNHSVRITPFMIVQCFVIHFLIAFNPNTVFYRCQVLVGHS